MWNRFLGRVPLEDTRPCQPSQEIKEASHALSNAAARLQGAVHQLQRESEFALAEFERRMQKRGQ